MANHDKLIKEMTMVDKMSTAERYEYAKRRRREQLDRYFTTNGHNNVTSSRRKIKISFKPDIVLLDAAARNDIDEGQLVNKTKMCNAVTHRYCCYFKSIIRIRYTYLQH